MRLICRASLAIVAFALGCGSPTETADPNVCNPASEFGATGCLAVEGHVFGLTGQSIAGVLVGAPAVPGFNGTYVETDSLGKFAFHLARYSGRPPAVGPDTLTISVRATIVPSFNGQAISVFASVFVDVVPVGQRFRPASVQITLPVTCRAAMPPGSCQG